MPLTRSADHGNVDGVIHSHRFPGANTALPTANGDNEQLEATEDFLKNNILSVDIFALSREPGASPAKRVQASPSCPRILLSGKKPKPKSRRSVKARYLPLPRR